MENPDADRLPERAASEAMTGRALFVGAVLVLTLPVPAQSQGRSTDARELVMQMTQEEWDALRRRLCPGSSLVRGRFLFGGLANKFAGAAKSMRNQSENLELAPRAGVEPATSRLTIECSNAELPSDGPVRRGGATVKPAPCVPSGKFAF